MSQNNKDLSNSDLEKLQNDNLDEQLILANTLTSLSRGSSPISHNRNSNSPLVALLNKPNDKVNSPLPSISTLSNNQNTSITQNNRNNSIMSTTSSVNSMLFPPPSPNLLFFNPSNKDTFNNGTIPGPLGNVFPTSFSQKKDNQGKILLSQSTQMLSINNPITSSVSTPLNTNLFFSKQLSVDTPPLGTLHNIKYSNVAKKNEKTKTRDLNDFISKKSSQKKPNFTNNVCQLPGSGISYSPQTQINSYYNNPSTLTNNLYNIQPQQGNSNSNVNFNSLMSSNNVENNFFLSSDSPLPNLQNQASYTGINSLLPQLFTNMGRPRSPRQVNLKINTAPMKFDSLTPVGLTPDMDNELIGSMKRKATTEAEQGVKRLKADKPKTKNGVKKRKKKKNIDDFSYMTQPSTGILYKVRLRDLIKELHPSKEEILEEDHTIQPQEVIQDDKGIRKYRCIHCMKFFQSGHHLTRHKTSVHSMIKLFECLRCGKQFKRKDHAWQHVCKKLSCPFLENAEEDLLSRGVICEEGDVESD